MKRCTTKAVILAALAAVALEARTPESLKADLAAIMPAGKKARCAYNKGGNFTEFPFYAWNTAIYVVDSDDGIVRQLHPKTGTGVFHHICLTADASRVIFYSHNSGKLGVINWDGTNYREVTINGKHCDYWRDPKDGSDWSLLEGGGMWRVNIDAPGTRVQLSSNGYGMSGFTLSDDGKMAVVNPNNIFGIQTIPGSNFTSSNHGGCWGNLGPGPNPRFNHNPPAGHHRMCLHDAADPTKFTLIETSQLCQAYLQSKGLVGTCSDAATNEGVRFTNHPDYVTFLAGKSTANPMLMRISDKQFAYIEDQLPCTFCGDMDVVFLDKSTGTVRGGITAPTRSLAHGPREAYSLDGRRLGAGEFGKRASGTPRLAIVRERQAVGVQLLD